MDVHGHKRFKKSLIFFSSAGNMFSHFKTFFRLKKCYSLVKLYHFLFCLDFYLSYVILFLSRELFVNLVDLLKFSDVSVSVRGYDKERKKVF